MNQEKKFKCDWSDCQFATTNSGSLKSHIRTHTNEHPFVCEFCDKGFKQNGNLKAHLRTHSGERPYSCEICDKVFSHSGSLKKHIRTHTGEKPYVCEICDKGFNDPSDLKRHIRTHTGEKPFSCEICDKKFSQSAHLTTHFRICTGQSKLNHPETLVSHAIEYFGLTWEAQKTFTNLRHKQPLRFDFYIPEIEAVVEYDGITHFKPIYGEEIFKKCKLRDKIKDDYCKLNDIPILRIPYWEKDNIQDLVCEFITDILEDY